MAAFVPAVRAFVAAAMAYPPVEAFLAAVRGSLAVVRISAVAGVFAVAAVASL